MMIVCEKCGTQMLDNHTTCPGCGAEVTPPATAGEVARAGSATESDVRTSAAAAARPQAAAAAAGRGMSAMTKAGIAVAIALLAASGLIFWQLTTGHAQRLNLTPEDMVMIAESAPPQQRMALASDPEARKDMAKNLRELLAVAEEARAKGYADRPEVKNSLEAMRHFVLAQLYVAKQREGGNPAAQPFTPEEVEALLKEPGRDAQFDQFLKDAQKVGLIQEGEVPEAQKESFKQRWGQAMLLSRKATASGLDKDRKTQLQLELQRASILAQSYSEELVKGLGVSDADVDASLAGARKEAEDLLKRARGGEDFEALAKQNSDEPGADQRGGDLGWFSRGQMVKEFEDTAFALQSGQLSDVIETAFGFHVIKVEGRRDKNEEGKAEEQVKARHILVRPEGISEPNRFSAPKPLREQVKESLGRKRQEEKIKQIVEHSKVQVPENFEIKMPEMPKTPMGSPHGEVPLPPPTSGDGQQGGAAPERKP
jgi:parvulin-like peptidyl-prolyl isomerase